VEGSKAVDTHVDVLIVGAGLSGIGAAYYLQKFCPQRRLLILEGRESIGGTWDLFRYPGVRSDSDMYTLGFGFRPWRDRKTIADGPSILNYIRETAQQYAIDRKIRFGHRVVKADWHSAEAGWTVEALHDGVPLTFTCNFLYLCTGYYDYDHGYTPEWAGSERFQGQIVHPQHWPADLDYRDKQVIVIGSGATAVTLVPAMSDRAAHVTLLQRSPSYIVSTPAVDRIAEQLNRHLPEGLAYQIVRWQKIVYQQVSYAVLRRNPAKAKATLVGWVRDELGPQYDIATHFTPRYNPWDERLCLVPDSDLFKAIRSGKVSVVTDPIEALTEQGILLKSGVELAADVIVTATGLTLKMMGGIPIAIDAAPLDISRAFVYKGMMLSNVPNLAWAFGYTNASWTLKCELTAQAIVRLLNYMDRHGYSVCKPRLHDPPIAEAPLLTFTSGYIRRGAHLVPRQGTRRPWKLYQNYFLDLLMLRFGRLNDGTLEFAKPRQSEG
jgi:cation diffusion facilitator CzcD-associated flavoprotein CzcO